MNVKGGETKGEGKWTKRMDEKRNNDGDDEVIVLAIYIGGRPAQPACPIAHSPASAPDKPKRHPRLVPNVSYFSFRGTRLYPKRPRANHQKVAECGSTSKDCWTGRKLERRALRGRSSEDSEARKVTASRTEITVFTATTTMMTACIEAIRDAYAHG